MKNFIAPADKLLTADQIAAKLTRLAPVSARRAELRAAIATEMGLGGSHPEVIREAYRRLRAGRLDDRRPPGPPPRSGSWWRLRLHDLQRRA